MDLAAILSELRARKQLVERAIAELEKVRGRQGSLVRGVR